MDIDKETNKKIEDLQILEHNLQNVLAQKQNVQLELGEILNALGELKKSEDEAYKIVAGIMIKSDKKNLTFELEEKKKLLNLRISSIEKQEKFIEKEVSELRDEIKDILTKSQKRNS